MLEGLALFGRFGSSSIGDYVKLAMDLGRIVSDRSGGGSPFGPLSSLLGGTKKADSTADDSEDEVQPKGPLGLNRQQQQQLAMTVGLFLARQALAARRKSRETPQETIDALTGRDLADTIENFSTTSEIDSKSGKRNKKGPRLTSADVKRIALAEADRLIELQERLSHDNLRLLKNAKLDSAETVVPVLDEEGAIVTAVPIKKRVGSGRRGGGGWLLLLGILAGLGAWIARLKEEDRAALLKSLSNMPGEVISIINEFRGKPYTSDYEVKKV